MKRASTLDRTINERLRGVSRMESLEIILERAQRPYTDDEKQAMATRKNAYYVELIGSLTRADHPARRAGYAQLSQGAGVKVAIGSSSKNTPIILARSGWKTPLTPWPTATPSPTASPTRRCFVLAARLLGLAPENCLVVEDADAGIEAAVGGGMRALGVGSAAGNPAATFHAPDLAHADFAAILG